MRKVANKVKKLKEIMICMEILGTRKQHKKKTCKLEKYTHCHKQGINYRCLASMDLESSNEKGLAMCMPDKWMC